MASSAGNGSMVHAAGLVKRFGDLEAVRGIDIEVRPGELFGFLGPNGAGKSSTMRMVGCVSPRSGGELRVFGRDPDTHGPSIRARLGVVPQEDNTRYFTQPDMAAIVREVEAVAVEAALDPTTPTRVHSRYLAGQDRTGVPR
jgi:ABC-type branched-subunit amino acid transport system ATPase component